MHMQLKRARSTPSLLPPLKRAKSEHDEHKPTLHSPPTPLPLTAAQGVERVPLLNAHRLSPTHLDQLATERTLVLRAQGRRVVGLPVVLSDGIVLHWVRHDDQNDVASNGNGSGASAADAITIPSRWRADTTHGATKLDSNSDIVLLPPFHSENHVPGNRSASLCPLTRKLSSPVGMSDVPSDIAPSQREHSSGHAEVTTTNLDVDETDSGIEDTNIQVVNTISVPHAKPPPLPSLQPVRELLARWKRRGDPERDVLTPEGTVVNPEGAQKLGRNEFVEDAHAITSNESDNESVHQASDPTQLKRVPLPKTDYGRARRLLVPDSAALPLVAVTMRGDCHFIERKKKFRISGYSLPNPGVFRHVGDVCMVGNLAVLGCDKGIHQVSLLSVAGRPQMIDIAWSPHSSAPRYQDMQKRGVSRLAAVHAEGGHIKFLSSGYDGTIHQWTVDAENPDEACSSKVVSHGACIMGLAYRGRDRSVVASVQRRLHITDLNRSTTATHALSNVIQQIHIHPQAAHITLLEVQHLDRQVLLYDSRKGNFDGEPCLSFGHRSANGRFSGGQTRGSAHLVHFTKAMDDGSVLLWDFRNGKKAVVRRCFQQSEKVVHTVFADSDIATFGEGVVTFFEDYLVT